MRLRNLEVHDSVFDPLRESPDARKRIVRYFKKDGRVFYRVWIYLSGEDLPYVDDAVYRLHPSFKHAVRKVKRTAVYPDCRLLIWTWGIFRVTVDVKTVDGKTYSIPHDLSYEKELETAKLELGKPGIKPKLV